MIRSTTTCPNVLQMSCAQMSGYRNDLKDRTILYSCRVQDGRLGCELPGAGILYDRWEDLSAMGQPDAARAFLQQTRVLPRRVSQHTHTLPHAHPPTHTHTCRHTYSHSDTYMILTCIRTYTYYCVRLY